MNIRYRHYFLRILFLFLMFAWLKIPIYSELTGTVTGKVIDEETGKGIKGVLIFLQSVGKDRYSHRSYRIETDNNGSSAMNKKRKKFKWNWRTSEKNNF